MFYGYINFYNFSDITLRNHFESSLSKTKFSIKIQNYILQFFMKSVVLFETYFEKCSRLLISLILFASTLTTEHCNLGQHPRNSDVITQISKTKLVKIYTSISLDEVFPCLLL